MSAASEVELQSTTTSLERSSRQRSGSVQRLRLDTEEPAPDSSNITTAVPDGGYGWVIVLACSIITFLFNGFSGSWGIIQAALLESSLEQVPTSTVTFVGSLALGCIVAFGLLGVRLMVLLGARNTAFIGITLLGLGQILSGFTTQDIGGLFGTSGVLVGLGTCLCYVIGNSAPVQYFSARLGLANGLVKLGGGLGATVLSLALQALIEDVGTAWMFRILGLITLATGLPAAWLIKERQPLRSAPFIDFSMFKSVPFVAIFLASAIGTFAIFVPPYFLPLFARSIGLSARTGAGLVAAFNGCGAIGRFGAGFICDKIGPLNTFAVAMLLNAVSMLAIWPVSNSIVPLTLFAVLNGIANGAFFTTLPTVVASLVGSGLAAVAMGMNITGWTGGYLLGTPIAGYLLQATHADEKGSVDPYRPAIFYAGGVALASFGFVLIARLTTETSLRKKV